MNRDKKIEEARKYFKPQWTGSVVDAYVEGSERQEKIDYRKSRKAFCNACPRKKECDDKTWDSIEGIRLAVECEWLDNFDNSLRQEMERDIV